MILLPRNVRRIARRAVVGVSAKLGIGEAERVDKLDLLFGTAAIARFMGLSKGQTRALVARKAIPVFELGGVLCARRSSIERHVARLEAAN